jgi:hypothetical protein
MVQPDRPLVAIQRMRIAYWMTKATDIHSEYVILIFFPTVTVVTRTRLNVVLYTLPALLYVKTRCYVELPPC